MKILHVIDGLNDGGAERLLACLARSDSGVESSVASLSAPTDATASQARILQEAGLVPSYIGVGRLLEPRATAAVAAEVMRSGCDVVHAHLEYSTVLAARAVRRTGHPFVSTLHHTVSRDSPLRERLKERWALRAAGRAGTSLFVSQASLQAAERLYGRRGADWRVIYNGVDMDGFTPPRHDGRAALPPELGVPAGAPVVAMVAALREPKGHRTAFQAWPAVRSAVPGAVLLVVGEGTEQEQLRAAAPEGVVLAGRRSDVAAILRGAAVALQTSYTEALPTALIEAAACGAAVVATDVGGTREVVQDRLTGLLIPPRNARATAAAVVELLTDDPLRSALATAGRDRVVDLFDHRSWGRRLAGLYHERAGGERHVNENDGLADGVR